MVHAHVADDRVHDDECGDDCPWLNDSCDDQAEVDCWKGAKHVDDSLFKVESDCPPRENGEEKEEFVRVHTSPPFAADDFHCEWVK